MGKRILALVLEDSLRQLFEEEALVRIQVWKQEDKLVIAIIPVRDDGGFT